MSVALNSFYFTLIISFVGLILISQEYFVYGTTLGSFYTRANYTTTEHRTSSYCNVSYFLDYFLSILRLAGKDRF